MEERNIKKYDDFKVDSIFEAILNESNSFSEFDEDVLEIDETFSFDESDIDFIELDEQESYYEKLDEIDSLLERISPNKEKVNIIKNKSKRERIERKNRRTPANPSKKVNMDLKGNISSTENITPKSSKFKKIINSIKEKKRKAFFKFNTMQPKHKKLVKAGLIIATATAVSGIAMTISKKVKERRNAKEGVEKNKLDKEIADLKIKKEKAELKATENALSNASSVKSKFDAMTPEQKKKFEDKLESKAKSAKDKIENEWMFND